jgi:hypothetical protein
MPTQIPALTELTDPQGADELLARDDSSGGDKRMSLDTLATFMAGNNVIVTADTTRTLTASDIGKLIVFTASSPITVTFPEDATEDLGTGGGVLIQGGGGRITAVNEGSDTFLSVASSNVTVQVGAPMVWKKIQSGEYFLGGAIA